VEFIEFVLSQLPPAPARVLEVGCGADGGVTPALAERGYDVLGVDPRAPVGPLFRQASFEEHEGEYDAVVASRVLHHVDDVGVAFDRLVALAPLLVLDEFAWERMDEPTIDWYERQWRLLAAVGADPHGPPRLDEWRAEHGGMHPSGVLRAELEARYDERHFEWRPYLYRWLGGPATLALEESLIGAELIRALGYRYAGTRTETTRSDASSR
jgi:hypothetical protein